MSRFILAALLVAAACDKGSRQPSLERLDPPAPTPQVAPSIPPPPPPPQPPRPEHVPPPAALADFVHSHASDPGEWRVYFREQKDPTTTRKAMLSRPASKELVDRLMKDDAFVTGDYGCLSDPLFIDLTRGTASLTLSENCGHLRVPPDEHDAMLAPELVQLIHDQRAIVLP